jgi:hypothetical protein
MILFFKGQSFPREGPPCWQENLEREREVRPHVLLYVCCYKSLKDIL